MAVLNASPAVVIEGFRPGRVTMPAVRVSGLAALVLALICAFGVTLAVSATVGAPSVPADLPVTSAPVAVETGAYPAWTVSTGDTLWAIAQATRPDADPRAVVLQIQALNGITSGHVLQAGEVLQLPRV